MATGCDKQIIPPEASHTSRKPHTAARPPHPRSLPVLQHRGCRGPAAFPATAVAPLGQVIDITHCSLFFACDSALSVCPAFVLRHPAELRSSGCAVTSGACQEHPAGGHCNWAPLGTGSIGVPGHPVLMKQIQQREIVALCGRSAQWGRKALPSVLRGGKGEQDVGMPPPVIVICVYLSAHGCCISTPTRELNLVSKAKNKIIKNTVFPLE